MVVVHAVFAENKPNTIDFEKNTLVIFWDYKNKKSLGFSDLLDDKNIEHIKFFARGMIKGMESVSDEKVEIIPMFFETPKWRSYVTTKDMLIKELYE